MDPISVLTTLKSIISYLHTVSAKVTQNREECHRLAAHAGTVFKLIETEIGSGVVAPEFLERLVILKRTLLDLNSTLDDLSGQSMLKKILWRDDVADQIAMAYKDLSEAIEIFNLGTQLDMSRVQSEREAARIADTERLHVMLSMIQHTDHEILEHLDVHKVQMQEAMLALQKRFLTLEDTLLREFLQKGMHAMQRRSGTSVSSSGDIPDMFVITSFDVVIHHDKKIGEGGCGQVFLGEWGGTKVAVKVLGGGVLPFIFQKEIDVWKRLRHPNILQFFGACSIADPPFLVCALKSQGDAMNFLHHHPEADRCRLLYEASMGLRYLHQNQVVHGDLKASNILIDEHGTACLCDFGLSKIRTHTTTVLSPNAERNDEHGTPRWMAPEQMSLGIINKMTDMYSFGMTMYQVFAGTPPFANTVDRYLFTVVVDRGMRPPRPSEPHIFDSGLDDEMWKLIEECWAQEPKDRPVIATVLMRLSIMRPASRKVEPFETTNVVATTSQESLSDASDLIDLDTNLSPPIASPVGSDSLSNQNLHSPNFILSGSPPASPFLSESPSPKQASIFSLTFSVPSVQHLAAALPNMQQQSYDPALKVAWARDVFFLVDRLQKNPFPAKPNGPIDIPDPQLARLVQAAIPLVLNIANPQPVPNPIPRYVAEAIYIRATFAASGAYPEFVETNLRSAFRDFELAARSGYSAAWFRLGRDYESFGDFSLARECFERGVKLAVESCIYRMGMAHLMGQLGLSSSPEKAVPLLHRAATLASLDVPQPAYVYGLLLAAEFPHVTIPPYLFNPLITPGSTPNQESRKHLERAAFLHFAPAQYKLGHCYEFAQPPFPFNPLLSVQYYSLASQQGETEADMALSKWFLCGAEGVFEKDESLAVTFAEKAARKGLPSAEFAMGYYAEVGVGCSKDVDSARKWYIKASEHGNADATERLQRLFQSQSLLPFSRQQHNAITEDRLIRKHMQAKQRSDATIPIGGDRPGPPPNPGDGRRIVDVIRKNSLPPQDHQEQQSQTMFPSQLPLLTTTGLGHSPSTSMKISGPRTQPRNRRDKYEYSIPTHIENTVPDKPFQQRPSDEQDPRPGARRATTFAEMGFPSREVYEKTDERECVVM